MSEKKKSLFEENIGAFPVTIIDVATINAIKSAGGYVNVQPEFAHVSLPKGTMFRADGRDKVYKLPSGVWLRRANHELFIVDSDDL